MVHYNTLSIVVISALPTALIILYSIYRYIKRKKLQHQRPVKKDDAVLAIE